MTVRPEQAGDEAGIFEVHRRAFPGVSEARLVDALRAAGRLAISLVAVTASDARDRIVGHIAFSPVELEGCAGGLGLAPLAVLPGFQRTGIGARLSREGLDAARRAGASFVVVLGDPRYYARFGFSAASGWGLADEFGGGNAFQALELRTGGIPRESGAAPGRRLARYAPEFAGLE